MSRTNGLVAGLVGVVIGIFGSSAVANNQQSVDQIALEQFSQPRTTMVSNKERENNYNVIFQLYNYARENNQNNSSKISGTQNILSAIQIASQNSNTEFKMQNIGELQNNYDVVFKLFEYARENNQNNSSKISGTQNILSAIQTSLNPHTPTPPCYFLD